MRFGILGPLTASRDGVAVDLGPPKQRLMVAVLLLAPEHAATVTELIEQLWGDPAPPSALANIRTYAHNLRSILDTGGHDEAVHLTTTGNGYRLAVGPDELDWNRFVQEAAAGRQAIAAGDLQMAVDRLDTALSLWRGEPLADLALPPALTAHVERLAEQRLLVEEDRAGVLVHTGSAAAILPRLRALVEEYPLRQRPWGQLMTALYRTGDLAGATITYQRAKQILARETGLDPSPELDLLYDDILNHRVADRVGGGFAGAPRRIRQLPPSHAGFVGRAAETATVLSWLDDDGGGPVVCVHGPGGVGKSTLVLRIAELVEARFAGGVLYVDLQGSDAELAPLEPGDALGRFLRALGVSAAAVPADPYEAQTLYRSQTAGRGLLVLLDNARDAAQVKPLLPGDDSCATLVTSRRVLATLPNSRGLALDLLTPTEAVRMLELDCGSERVSAEPAAAAQLAWLGGHLPLALRIIGARLASRPQWPLSRLATRLDDPEQRLDALEYDDLSVRMSARSAYRQLEDGDPRRRQSARVLRLIGGTRLVGVTVCAVAALLGETPDQARNALEDLADLRLVDAQDDDTYLIHDLLRLFAREQARTGEPAESIDAALGRLIESYMVLARRAESLANGHWSPVPPPRAEQPWLAALNTPEEAAAWYAQEHANIIEAFQQGADIGGDLARSAARLARACAASLRRYGYPQEAIRISDGSVELTRRLGMDVEHHAALFHRSRLRAATGDLAGAEADLLAGLEVTLAAGDLDHAAISLDALGYLRYRMGDPAGALVHQERALEFGRELGNDLQIGASLCNLTHVRMELGQRSEAHAGALEALRIGHAIDSRGLVGASLGQLAQLHWRIGEWDRAAQYGDEALACAEALGDLPNQCESYLTQAAVRLSCADPAGARQAAEDAARIADRYGDRYLYAIALWAQSAAARVGGDTGLADALAGAARTQLVPFAACREPTYIRYFGVPVIG